MADRTEHGSQAEWKFWKRLWFLKMTRGDTSEQSKVKISPFEVVGSGDDITKYE